MGVLNSDALLKDKYDVIFIGAGLGSLTAAALLAKKGIEVLVVEQHFLPGGACTSFKREDRIFDSGAALFFGFGTEGFHPERILMNALEEELEIIPRDAFFRLNFEGKIINFYKDINKFVEELKRAFPDEKEELEAFYSYLMTFYAKNIKGYEMLTTPSEMTSREKLRMLFGNPVRTMNMVRLLKKSAKDIMEPYIKSKRLVEFFDMLCSSYIYCTAEETPAIMALTTFTDNHVGGSYYIAGSAQTYSNTLEKSIEKNNGTILYRQRVAKIIFDVEKASGVLLSDGVKIKADKIVSGTTVWNLYNNLIPAELLSEKQKDWVDSLDATYPAMILHTAVAKNVFPADTKPVEYYVSDSSEIDMGDITMYIPTFDDHSLGPEDEHLLTIFSPAPNQSWPRPNEPEYHSEDYESNKQKQAKLILDEIEDKIPDFRKGIRMLHIATPSTIEQYTLKNWGCVGGPRQRIGQDLSNRLHAKTDWKNLYACGDSTTMGMGLPAVTVSGFAVANIILREYKKKTYKDKDLKDTFVNSINSKDSFDIPNSIDNDPEQARKIARLCQHCQNAPCIEACPANIDIPNFIRRIEAGNFNGSARAIREKNPMAATCSIFCSPGALCEKNCYRNTFTGSSMPIQELNRWVVSYTGKKGWPDHYSDLNGKKIAIIGAGPSGLTCAYYLARLGYEIDIFEKSEKAGGSILNFSEKASLIEKVIRNEIEQMISCRINIIYSWDLKEKDQLNELNKNYNGIYLSAPLNFDLESLPKSSFIITGGRWYSTNSESYVIADSVRDGRIAAQKIHNLGHPI
ncbi:MAG: NAD(P)-binding protein [Candidatus Lokiarchaeota archaeon]|nr:NAD(P)-binding protein [Candidatus Lokiarchaeota archaeon]